MKVWYFILRENKKKIFFWGGYFVNVDKYNYIINVLKVDFVYLWIYFVGFCWNKGEYFVIVNIMWWFFWEKVKNFVKVDKV